MLLRLLAMARSASAMSVPISKFARTRERFSSEVDWMSDTPSTPEIARSIGAVTSRTTAFGFAEG